MDFGPFSFPTIRNVVPIRHASMSHLNVIFLSTIFFTHCPQSFPTHTHQKNLKRRFKFFDQKQRHLSTFFSPGFSLLFYNLRVLTFFLGGFGPNPFHANEKWWLKSNAEAMYSFYLSIL